MKGWVKTMAIDNHKRIQNMSLDEMAKYFGDELKVCHKSVPICPIGMSCQGCWKEFLQECDK